jgi:hypothetical protein
MKQTPLDLFIAEMQSHPVWPAMVERLQQERPTIPEFSPSQDNTELWKQASGRRQGYDLCLTIFKLKVE